MKNQPLSESEQKDLSEKVKKIKKAIPNDLPKLLPELCPFVPNGISLFIQQIGPKLTENLAYPLKNPITSAVVDFICFMINKAEKKIKELKELDAAKAQTDQTDSQAVDAYSELRPNSSLVSQKKFFDNLFGLMETYDDRIMYIVESLYSTDPLYFVKWILSQKKIEKSPFMNLVNLVINTQNLRAGRRLQLFVVSSKDVTPKLIPIIQPILKKLPVSIVIDLMIPSPEIRNMIPQNELEPWLLSYQRFTLSDIEQITKFFNEIWLSETSIKLLLRSTVPQAMQDIEWMAKRGPQLFTLSQPLIRQACNQFRPGIKFTGPCKDCQTTRSPYMFIRMFIISLGNPSDVSSDVHNMVYDMVKSKNEYVSCAALQCILVWMLKFCYKIKPFLVYRVAGIKPLSEPHKLLIICALHVFGLQEKVAVAILQTEEELRITKKQQILMNRENWMFSHFKPYVKNILNIKLVDYNQALDYSEYILGYLHDADDQNVTENVIKEEP